MIDRYTRPEMGAHWTAEARFQTLMEVEIAVALAQADLKMIPRAAAEKIKKKAAFQVDRILEIEKTTKHDIIAFVSNMAENVGPEGRFIHFGLTSSDVLDTASSLQVQRAGELLLESVAKLQKALLGQIRRHRKTICAGRTHGMHAEPTTFGFKLAGFYAELERNEKRLRQALSQMAIAKLSGAVGTYSAQSRDVERKVARSLGLVSESIATQVVPRDRHAELFFAISMIGAGIERLSVELRHLQRTEVSEALEGFSKGQKGSSAMPHKRNPIGGENLTGAARLLRAYLQAAMEDIALWHERDISHSSVERVIFPDAFILCDYALTRLATIVENLEVREDRMKANMELSQGQLFSSHLLLLLVEKGLSREEAYAHVQSLSHTLKPGQSLALAAVKDQKVSSLAKKKEIEDVFTGKRHLKQIDELLSEFIARATSKKTSKKGRQK